jgi:pyruvate/2-oxoglutarate dehydrogenase complex dihydrolipoamide dehydrogenase (E3) component
MHDMIVIGAWRGGYVGAIRAAHSSAILATALSQ